jgi:hypothetical protein
MIALTMRIQIGRSMKKQFSRRIDKELIEALKSYAESERKTDTEVMGNALREYLRDKGYWPPSKNK